MKNKKPQTEKIEIRVDLETKNAFSQYAKSLEKNISQLLREYMKECIKNGSNN